MRAPVPVVLPGITCTPAACPTSRLATSVTGAVCTRVAASTFATLLPSSTRRCSPVAVVTTSCSFTTTGVITKSSTLVWPALTVIGFFCSAYPTRRTRMSNVPAGTPRMVYWPVPFVDANSVVPMTMTRVSGSGSPLPSAVTRPEMAVVCPKAIAGISASMASATMIDRSLNGGRGIFTGS